jgi:hypothetical protein
MKPPIIPRDLWQALCLFLETHETCQVVIHQNQGRVWKLDLGLVKESVRAGEGDVVHVGDMPVYSVPSPHQSHAELAVGRIGDAQGKIRTRG